jgi:hypothetical protein
MATASRKGVHKPGLRSQKEAHEVPVWVYTAVYPWQQGDTEGQTYACLPHASGKACSTTLKTNETVLLLP